MAKTPRSGARRGDADKKTTDTPEPSEARRTVERIQTGVRMERRILGVLKALADLYGMSLGDLIEGIVLHAFEGKAPFSPESLEKIRSLKQVFGLDLDASDSHLLVERGPSAPSRRRAPPR